MLVTFTFYAILLFFSIYDTVYVLLLNNPFLDAELLTASRIGQKRMLDKRAKQKIINKFKTHETDTGSSQVQIAILTEEIKQLAEHLKKHKHDNSSRRGLLKKVAERRRLLKYLQKEDTEGFKELTKKLKLDIAKKMIVDEEEKLRREQELMAAKEEKEEAKELAAKEKEEAEE